MYQVDKSYMWQYRRRSNFQQNRELLGKLNIKHDTMKSQFISRKEFSVS